MSSHCYHYTPLSDICFSNESITDWQFDEKAVSRSRKITQEAKSGIRRPIQIVVATNRNLPFGEIVDSIILSTEGTGLLQAKRNNSSVVRFTLLLKGEDAVSILSKNQNHISRLKNSGVQFNFEICNNSNSSSELSSARECALNYMRRISKEDNPIFLWLDDDLSFDSLIAYGNYISQCRPWSFFHEVWLFHESFPDVEVGLGDVTGAPPLPASSTLYTNICDLVAGFNGEETRTDFQRWREHDYYYDLSDYDRNLEPWYIDINNLDQNQILFDLLENGIVARPLVVNGPGFQIQHERYIRGGNTIIFNSEWLDKIGHPNIPRRGDSIWSLMIKKRGGVLGHFPIPLRHIRDIRSENWTPKKALDNWLRRLEDDLIGASYQRFYADDNSILSPENILVKRANKQLKLFDSALKIIHKLPKKIENTLRHYIQSGIKKTQELIENPEVFSPYYKCMKENVTILENKLQPKEVKV